MAFSGSLNANKMFTSLFNMIISQEVFADNFGKHQTLVDKARVDGDLYGDQKLYYSADVLHSYDWTPFATGSQTSELLKRTTPDSAPSCQTITLDKFRQIAISVDNYLTKQAWASEGAFAAFNSVMVGMLSETKKVYDGTTYNVFVGTSVAGSTINTVNVSLGSSTNRGLDIAKALADLLSELGDYSREYNALGFLRSYAPEDLKVVFNAKFVNEIEKVDLPVVFHKDGLIEKLNDNVMPARYFGVDHTADNATAIAALITAGVLDNSYKVVANKGVRFKEETKVGAKYYFAGDLIPAGTVVATSSKVTVPFYVEDDKAICKVISKLPPYMSGFETQTSFLDQQTLRENNWLTFGHNTLQILDDSAFITLEETV